MPKTRKAASKEIFILPKKDILIMADQSDHGGVFVEKGSKAGHMISGAAMRFFVGAWFGPRPKRLSDSFRSFEDLDQIEALLLAKKWLSRHPGVQMAGKPPLFGPLRKSYIKKGQRVALAGFAPFVSGTAGTMQNRKVGKSTVYILRSDRVVNTAAPFSVDVPTTFPAAEAGKLMDRFRAIRNSGTSWRTPPRNSFSWLSSRTVTSLANGPTSRISSLVFRMSPSK